MVQRTVGRVVSGVVVAALVAAGSAQAQGAGKATVVLRDGRKIEAATVEFRERTFVVRTADGTTERLDERDVLRVELGAPGGPADPRKQVLAQTPKFVGAPGQVSLEWRGPSDPTLVWFGVSRRELPDGAWVDVPGTRQICRFVDKQSVSDKWVTDDPAVAWPRRYEYRLRTFPITGGTDEARTIGKEVVGEVTLPPIAPARGAWVVPAGRSGDQVLVHVRCAADEKPRAHLAVRPGEPILVDGRPTGAKVVAAVVEADGVPAIRVAWDGLAEPELVRADHVFGVPAADRRSAMTKVEGAPPAVDPARKVAVDLDDGSQLEFARTVARLTGLDVALVAEDSPTLDVHLRSVAGEQLVSLGAELLGKKLSRWAGVRALSSKGVELSERLPAPEGPLASRLAGERLALWVSADGTFDLEDALELFRATTAIDVVVSTKATKALQARRAPASVFVHARGATLAQALSLLTSARGLTWTTRGDVVLVKTLDELRPEEVWLDLDLPQGAPIEALRAPLDAAGVGLAVRGFEPGTVCLPESRGRVQLTALVGGLKTEWDVDPPVWFVVTGVTPLPGVLELRAKPSGDFFDVVDTQRGSTSVDVGLEQVLRSYSGFRMRLWAKDPLPIVARLRAAKIDVVAVNNLPPPPVAPAPTVAPEKRTSAPEPRTFADWKRIQVGRPVETDAELQAAVEAARKVYNERSGDPDAAVALGRASLKFLFMGPEGIAVALQLFDGACAAAPGNAEAWFHRGLCHALGGGGSGSTYAFNYLAEALQRSLGNIDMLLSRAQLRVSLGRAPDALQDVEAVVRSAPQRADGWACLAQVRSSLGDREGALQAIREALKLTADHSDAGAWRELLAKLEEQPSTPRETLEGLEAKGTVCLSYNTSEPRPTCVLVPAGTTQELPLAVGDAYAGYVLEALVYKGEGRDPGLILTFRRGEERRTVHVRSDAPR